MSEDPLARKALGFCSEMREQGIPAFVIYMDEEGNPRMACLRYPFAVVEYLLTSALETYRKQVPNGAHN